MRVFLWFPQDEQKKEIPGKNGECLYLEINSDTKDLLINSIIIFFTKKNNTGARIDFKITHSLYDHGYNCLYFKIILVRNEATKKQTEFFFRKWKYTPYKFDIKKK